MTATSLNRGLITVAIASHMSLDNPLVRQTLGHGLAVGLGHETATALNDLIDRQASVIAYLDEFKLLAIGLLAMIPLLLVMRRPASAAELPIME
jgi:DHA2 family multidrug resistance protein